MKLYLAEAFSKRRSTDLLVVPFWEEAKKAVWVSSFKEIEAICAPTLNSGDFLGKEGELTVVYGLGKEEKRILLLGLGKKSACTEETVRRAYGSMAKWAHKKQIKTVAMLFPEEYAASGMEGFLLANYLFDRFKAKPLTPVEEACLVGISKSVFEACKKVAVIVEAVNFSRDLINGNADDVTPQYLCQVAKDLSREHASLKTTILDHAKVTKEKMGLLLAVGQGAMHPPALIIIEYRGNPKDKEVTAVVGKGITYDTGGLNIKTANMETMKDDMSGAAAVLGTLKAAATLKMKVNLIGVIPTAENAVGPKSYKPGDVFRSYSGKTVEISNTDAEGRLVLADGLSYLQKHYKPSRIIDFATLTGAIVITLGEEASGLFSNNDRLANQLMNAGDKTGEYLCRLPIYPEYREPLRSEIADIKNSGDRKGSSIQGAMFLKEFIGEIPWAHCDIAGTAYLSKPRRYHSTPATGVGVRLMIQFLEL